MSEKLKAFDVLNDQKQFYNDRFREGYMKDFAGVFEASRLYTFKEILNNMKAEGFNPVDILDYGCGEGRYIGILKEFFPESFIYGSDISDMGLSIAKKHYSFAQYISMSDEVVNFIDKSFDLIICIEVLEHVKDVKKSIKEIGRLLRHNGTVIITTPCSNKYSFEWAFNKLTKGLQQSFDGYNRFATDEPAHLRRLNDNDIIALFSKNDIDIYKIYHRAHFFTTLMMWKPMVILPESVRVWIGLIDWHLFKNFPNGATMVATGKKINIK